MDHPITVIDALRFFVALQVFDIVLRAIDIPWIEKSPLTVIVAAGIGMLAAKFLIAKSNRR
ncbi:hypothetical protein [Hartmannibacter diazotrophicus]|uniref:hypothetical protein n=1 Tax=Hartmannibacter diazotrophicus TaxID=1482074 RepID=UPI001AECD400|nr:hypothetical protein [Hartmannibacter diazotrophicus]